MSKKIVLIINLIILLIFTYVILDVFGILGKNAPVTIEIQENDNMTVITQKLYDEKVIVSKTVFKFFYKINTSQTIIKPGIIEVTPKMPYREIIRAIKMPSSTAIKVTIPEGFEIREIADRLVANELVSNADEFFDALKQYSFQMENGTIINGSEYMLSGYLYPDTYEFYKNSSSKEIIDKLVKNFKKNWTPEYDAQAKKIGYTMDEIINLASIIEREARHPEDFPVVSSVFHNRLKNNKMLESCATVQYILKDRKKVLSVEDTKIKSPYNTYRNKGLPPSPIASPGDLAIKSALFPEKTDYLFFFTDKNGVNHYSKTYNEHNEGIEKYGL